MEIKRKLASIQKISKLHTLEQFDNLVLAEVQGWKCLVNKTEFKEGDYCVYFEIDSMLPIDIPELSFMQKYHYRVKTIKMHGVYSQGLAMSLSILKDKKVENIEEGMDLTDILGVTQFESKADLVIGGDIAGLFPNSVPKTDQERIQNCKKFLDKMLSSSMLLNISEKIDGCSCTIGYDEQRVDSIVEGKSPFFVCSRNFELKEIDNSVFWKIAKKYNLEEILKKYQPIVFQGEIVGQKIQKNKYNLKEVYFKIFDMWNIKEQRYLNQKEFDKIIEENPGLETVPIICVEKQPVLVKEWTAANLVEYSKNISMLNKDIRREGIVIKQAEEIDGYVLGLNRLSFKVLNPDFLLKYD